LVEILGTGLLFLVQPAAWLKIANWGTGLLFLQLFCFVYVVLGSIG
jgi:hypothetical protein